jgi:hypothetical protein
MNKINNILPEELSKEYLNLVSGNNFPWFFYNDIAVEKDLSNELNVPTKFGFSHTPFFDGEPKSPYFDYFMHGANIMAEKFDTKINKLLRIRLGLQTRNDNQKVLYLPHVDFEFDHKVILYYFNTCDGDTIMYNEKLDPDNYTGYPQTYTENCRMSPEENSAIFFDGKTFHAYESPVKNSARFVMNVVFE